MKRARIGRNMRRACRYVDSHPGCAIIDVATHLARAVFKGPQPPATLSGGYATVHRCIDQKLIDPNRWASPFGLTRYRLTTTDAGRALAKEEIEQP